MRTTIHYGSALPYQIFFSIGFAFLLPLFLMMAYAVYCSVAAAQTFVQVDAVVLENTIVSRGDGSALLLGYIYEVNGVRYRSSRYSFGLEYVGMSMPANNAREREVVAFQKQYPPGTQIRPYLNPRDPSEATVLLSHAYFWYELLLIALVAFSFGVGCTISICYPRKAEKYFKFSDPS